MEQSHHFSLYALNALVHEAVSNALPDEYWVEAELAECRERNGHCYMELVEKDERSNSPIAKASAKCWRQTWTLLHATFLRATGQPLRAGMKVLLRVYPQFHEAYGFSWIVSDIDPTYTIGDLARRRQEIIKTLKAQGVFDPNANYVCLPLLSALPLSRQNRRQATETSVGNCSTTNTTFNSTPSSSLPSCKASA